MPRYLLSFVVALMTSAPLALKSVPRLGNTSMHVVASPVVLLWQGGEAVQPIALEVRHTGQPIQTTLRVGDLPAIETSIEPGVQSIQAYAGQMKMWY